ncbi:hypothetical protein D3874_03190 [Oleomonas cavernae]|uniref:Uncharacterized protein n=1 Tax=Oleomonas cavernae TaxID=2320859 RepID=A0A418WU87_9PROT|nr:hypothetical protein [Oleomonas cavernae]RJF94833.1 hypothetical protein D3874_03190 [Oleomonas cavernae]
MSLRANWVSAGDRALSAGAEIVTVRNREGIDPFTGCAIWRCTTETGSYFVCECQLLPLRPGVLLASLVAEGGRA